MTRLTWLARAGVALLFGSVAADPAPQEPPRGRLALTGITVIDVVGGQALRDRTVLVADGRIESVGARAAVRVPAGTREVPGAGKFLIPGLIDTHIHLANSADRDKLTAIGPLLAHGVTGIRDAGTGGQDEWLVALRGRVDRGDILSPRIYVSGMVSGRSVARSGLPDAAALTRRLIDIGVDGVKIRDGLTREAIESVIDVAAKANRPVYGHTYDAVSRERDEIYTLDAVRGGVRGSMHIMGIPQLGAGGRPPPPPGPRFGSDWRPWWVYYATLWRFADRTAERTLMDTMVDRGAWLEPTLITEDWIVNAAGYRDAWRERRLPASFDRMREGFPTPEGPALEQYREAFARMKEFVRRFHEAGGVITAGTDCLPVCGYGLQDELRILVSAGLTPAAAMRAATVDAARVLGWQDRVGRVAPGLLADLVVLDGNPLQDIRHAGRVHAVITDGRYVDRAQLDGLLVTAPGDPAARDRPR
jgi:imidazolonepropionase-like amidohydrolase